MSLSALAAAALLAVAHADGSVVAVVLAVVARPAPRRGSGSSATSSSRVLARPRVAGGVRRRTASACRSRSRRRSAGSPSGSATTMPTTSSSLPRLMPLTPRVLRPIGRASASSKRIAMPLRVLSTTSSPGLVRHTSISCRPRPGLMPMMPPAAARLYSVSVGLLHRAPAGGHQQVIARRRTRGPG